MAVFPRVPNDSCSNPLSLLVVGVELDKRLRSTRSSLGGCSRFNMPLTLPVLNQAPQRPPWRWRLLRLRDGNWELRGVEVARRSSGDWGVEGRRMNVEGSSGWVGGLWNPGGRRGRIISATVEGLCLSRPPVRAPEHLDTRLPLSLGCD